MQIQPPARESNLYMTVSGVDLEVKNSDMDGKAVFPQLSYVVEVGI